MWISSLKLNSRPKVPKIAVVWNSLHTYLKENHDADVIMAESQHKNSASSDSTSDNNDDPYSPDELSDNDNENNPGNNANQQRGTTNEPSASSSNTSNDLFVWTQPLLNYLIWKFSSTGTININKDSVTEKNMGLHSGRRLSQRAHPEVERPSNYVHNGGAKWLQSLDQGGCPFCSRKNNKKYKCGFSSSRTKQRTTTTTGTSGLDN